MPFSQKKLVQLKSGIAQKLSSSSISDWERDFLHSMQAKLDRYGQRTRLTDKQYSTLMRMVPISSGKDNVVHVSARSKPGQAKPVRGQIRPKRTYKPRLKKKLRGYLMLVVLGVALTGIPATEHSSSNGSKFNGLSSETYQKSISTRDIRVIDGDTIKVTGESRSYRLVGFNTAETKNAQCSRERELGYMVTSRLAELLSTASEIELRRVRCACKPGTEGTQACNFGRLCGRLYVEGQDVGSKLITEGLAVRYICGATSCPPRPGNWCG